MPFDDNYPSLDIPMEDAAFKDPGVFDPSPIPSTPGAARMQGIINDNAEWLQAEPRTSLTITFHLFPGMVRTISDASDAAEMIGAYLWDAGYVPRNTDCGNPTWHWLEGKPLPSVVVR